MLTTIWLPRAFGLVVDMDRRRVLAPNPNNINNNNNRMIIIISIIVIIPLYRNPESSLFGYLDPYGLRVVSELTASVLLLDSAKKGNKRQQALTASVEAACLRGP